MSNPNTNCLAGFQCPKCENYGPFFIAVRTAVTVHDNGTDNDFGDIEWSDESNCHCLDCDHNATVADFTEKA
jgi:hypothetical protein